MFVPGRYLGSCEPPSSDSLDHSNRNEKKNHTSKLRELALLLPISQKSGTKKLTKKEILLHVLHYIRYLQSSISVAQTVIGCHISGWEAGAAEPTWEPATPGRQNNVLNQDGKSDPVSSVLPPALDQNSSSDQANQRFSTPPSSPSSQNSHLWGACHKPRKKKCKSARGSEEQDGPQMLRRSLDLHKPEEGETPFPDLREENLGVTITPPKCADPCDHLPAAQTSFQDGGEEGIFQLVTQDLAENGNSYDFTNFCAMGNAEDNEPKPDGEAQRAVETAFLLTKVQLSPRQMLASSEELDKEILGADIWLPAWEKKNELSENQLGLEPPQSNIWGAAGYASNNLPLSPLFFSSPSKVLPEPILQDDTFYLTEGLLEDAFLQLESLPTPCPLKVPLGKDGPSWAPQDLPGSSGQSRPFIPLDQRYLSLSDSSEMSSGSTSEDTDTATDTESMWEQEEDLQADPEGMQSSSNEDDCAWTPTRQALNPPWGRRTAKKNRAHRVPGKPKENKKAPCSAQAKKKCVNGFIMFCRMNRKQYIRACPGTASTAATKELAQLWRMMSLKERRPYCAKARRFSRQHNRVVKRESSSSDEDWEIPKPFYQLLAQRACAPPVPSQLPNPHHQ